MNLSIVILGSGNIAAHIAQALVSTDVVVKQIYSRNVSTGTKISNAINVDFTNDINKICKTADMYLFAMPPKATLENIEKLNLDNNKILVHTDGSQNIDVFSNKTANYGVFYPFQTFSANIKLDFSKTPIFIQASNATTKSMLIYLAMQCACNYYEIDDKQRIALHIAGVFASNFTNHCVNIAQDILNEHNIDEKLLFPLIEQNFNKILTNGSYHSQTGPARRGDVETINKHLQILKTNKTYFNIYENMSNSINKLYNNGN